MSRYESDSENQGDEDLRVAGDRNIFRNPSTTAVGYSPPRAPPPRSRSGSPPLAHSGTPPPAPHPSQHNSPANGALDMLAKNESLTELRDPLKLLEEEEVYLPPKRLLRKKNLYSHPPNVDKKAWTLYKCEKLVGPLDYYEAHKKSKEMSGQSGSDEENPKEKVAEIDKTRKRKAAERFSPSRYNKKERASRESDGESSSGGPTSGSGEDSDSSSSDSDDNKRGENDSVGESEVGSSDDDQEEKKDGDEEDDDDDSDKDDDEAVVNCMHSLKSKEAAKTKASQSAQIAQRKKRFDASNLTQGEQTRLIQKGFKKLHEEIQNVNSKVDDMMDKPNKKLKSSKKLLPKFPSKNAKGVIALEKKLAKKKYREIFESLLENIGGHDTTNLVRNSFRKTIAPKLVKKFSWSGQRTKKCPFKNLRICQSIIAVVSSCTDTEAEVKKEIMIKLQHAKEENARAKESKLSMDDLATLLS